MKLTFGDCVFDSGTREIFRGDRLVSVSPKAFQLFEILIGEITKNGKIDNILR